MEFISRSGLFSPSLASFPMPHSRISYIVLVVFFDGMGGLPFQWRATQTQIHLDEAWPATLVPGSTPDACLPGVFCRFTHPWLR